jgi:hypothetical protein
MWLILRPSNLQMGIYREDILSEMNHTPWPWSLVFILVEINLLANSKHIQTHSMKFLL